MLFNILLQLSFGISPWKNVIHWYNIGYEGHSSTLSLQSYSPYYVDKIYEYITLIPVISFSYYSNVICIVLFDLMITILLDIFQESILFIYNVVILANKILYYRVITNIYELKILITVNNAVKSLYNIQY